MIGKGFDLGTKALLIALVCLTIGKGAFYVVGWVVQRPPAGIGLHIDAPPPMPQRSANQGSAHPKGDRLELR